MAFQAKTFIKTALRGAGLFPIFRYLYRRANRQIQNEIAENIKFYGQFLQTHSRVFDIGANLGQKTEIFLACGCEVVSVEPNPLCHASLQYYFGNNPFFRLVKEAAGATISAAVLNVVGTDSTASLRSDWKWLSAIDAKKVEVKVTTLDALIAAHGKPAFCKIDIEGYELECLRGLSQAIDFISFEYHTEEEERMIKCLQYLNGFSDIRINLIGMNEHSFVLDKWVGLDEFLLIVEQSRLPKVGDIFVAKDQLTERGRHDHRASKQTLEEGKSP